MKTLSPIPGANNPTQQRGFLIDRKTLIVAFVACLALVIGGYWSVQTWRIVRAVSEAKKLVAIGLSERAGERLDPFFDRIMVSVGSSPDTSRDTCALLLDAYLPARNATRLLRVTQECGRQGPASPEHALALAESYVRLGKAQEAIEAFRIAVKQYPKLVRLQLRAAEFFSEQQLAQDAAEAILRAVRSIPEDMPLAAEGLRRLAGIKRWKDAAEVATRLAKWDGHTVETRLLAARALHRAGKPDSAFKEVDGAIELLQFASVAERAQWVQEYPELLSETLAGTARGETR